MKKILECFTALNKNQKISLLITSAICMLLLALHNPFGGYATESCYANVFGSGCADLSIWYFKSNFAVFDWIQGLGRLVGFIVPVLLFGAISNVILCSK